MWRMWWWRMCWCAESQFVRVCQCASVSAPAQCQCRTNYPRLSPGNIPSPVTSMGTVSSSWSIGDTASPAELLIYCIQQLPRHRVNTGNIIFRLKVNLQSSFIISRLELLLVSSYRFWSEMASLSSCQVLTRVAYPHNADRENRAGNDSSRRFKIHNHREVFYRVPINYWQKVCGSEGH